MTNFVAVKQTEMLYLKSLEIENVRCFGKKQRIDFCGKDGKISQWTVILGDNGAGKTTLLRSIVSMLPTPSQFIFAKPMGVEYSLFQIEINPSYINKWSLKHKNGDKNSNITLEVAQCREPFNEIIEYVDKMVFSFNHNTNSSIELPIYDNTTQSPVYCFAYGANRKMGAQSLSGEKLLDTSDTLFDEEALLQNSQEFYLQLDYDAAKERKGNGKLNKVKELLIKILPPGVKDIRVAKTGSLQREVQLQTPLGWVSINELSLGYKTTIAWLMDFATKMMYYHQKSDNPFAEPAILVLDELDLHMHPSWQREIIDNLTVLFPSTQFIVTAHSPLVVQSALDSNIVLLKRESDHIKIVNERDTVNSWRVDQVLTSDLFGMEYSRPKHIEKKIEERRNLIRKGESISVDEKRKLEILNKEIYKMPIGDTQSEMAAMDILRNFAEKLESIKK